MFSFDFNKLSDREVNFLEDISSISNKRITKKYSFLQRVGHLQKVNFIFKNRIYLESSEANKMNQISEEDKSRYQNMGTVFTGGFLVSMVGLVRF